MLFINNAISSVTLFVVLFLTTGCASTRFVNEAYSNKDITMRKIVQTSDHIKISWQLHNLGHKQVVVIAHGFYNSKEALLLKQLGQDLSAYYDIALIDFRGHGHSEGLFHWTSKEYLDLIALLEELKKSYDSIGVIGFSLGAATTLITAAKSSLIDSIVLVSPPSDFDKIEYRLWELDFKLDIKYSLFGEGRVGKGVRPGPWWLIKEKPINSIKHIQQPVYLIHGTKDWIIKPWHSQALFEVAASKNKKIDIIPEGPHAEYLMLTHQHFMVEQIINWFKGTLS